jgi:hypothetical protein
MIQVHLAERRRERPHHVRVPHRTHHIAADSALSSSTISRTLARSHQAVHQVNQHDQPRRTGAATHTLSAVKLCCHAGDDTATALGGADAEREKEEHSPVADSGHCITRLRLPRLRLSRGQERMEYMRKQWSLRACVLNLAVPTQEDGSCRVVQQEAVGEATQREAGATRS